MPSVSEKQRRFMRMELAKKRAGKKGKTKMTVKQLREFAKEPIKKSRSRKKSEWSKTGGGSW